MPPPDVSVILVNWNSHELTEAAVNSLRVHEKTISLEIIVVDNASTDGSAENLEKNLTDIRVIRGTENEGFARGNNRGVAMATGKYVLLLNSDTIFQESVLPTCLQVLQTRGPVIVGCRLLNADGSLQLSAEGFPRLRELILEIFMTTEMIQRRKLRALPPKGSRPSVVDWLCGAFLLVERETYVRLGGLSPNIFMYGEDTEFCWRAAKSGIPSIYVPDVAITHIGNGTARDSLRRLMISDLGRLRAFAMMRGHGASFVLRIILMSRSALRALAWGIPGLLTVHPTRLGKASLHWREFFILSGLPFKFRRSSHG
jgi:GT2 family glycosyltransferase